MKSFKEFLSEEKSSKEEVNYQNEPKGKAKCSNCSMFRPPSSCTAVSGKIYPNGWCKLHEYATKE